MKKHNLKYLAPQELKPYFNNPRKNENAIVGVAESIAAYDFQQPILVDEDLVILAGHTRWKAAMQLKLAEIPVVISHNLSEKQKRAYRIADNRYGETAGWDFEKLQAEIEDLDNLPMGFEEGELEALFATLEDTIEATPEDDLLPEAVEPRCKPGDLWQLGKHRLLCGDATNADNVERLFADELPQLLVTDPPYGVSYDPGWRKEAGINKNPKKMGKVSNDDIVDWSHSYALAQAPVAYVWHAGRHAREVQVSLEKCDYEMVSQIIWAKDRFALSRGDYHWQHEPCWYAVKKGARHNWQGARDQSTLWRIPRADDQGHGHGTQKPLECMLRPILNNTRKGDLVYDAFGGSGTTLIAAERSGRKCLMMEIDPGYCDIIIQRWEALSGSSAMLISKEKAA